MSIEKEAKEFVEERKKEKKAFQCSYCKNWSGYGLHDIPRAWTIEEKGYKCEACNDNKKGKRK